MSEEMFPVAQLPAVQRDLYLARALGAGANIVETLRVGFPDIEVVFETDSPVSSAVVQVSSKVLLAALSEQLERLLDCYAPTPGAEWVVKWSTTLSRYGRVDKVRQAMCDRIVSVDAETGETIGALKRKRRSVSAGHGTVRLAPAEDSLQLVLRHSSAQGLKALWKSVFHRLEKPRRAPGTVGESPSAPRGPQSPYGVVVLAPCIRVKNNPCWAGDWVAAAKQVAIFGREVDLAIAEKKGVEEYFPLNFLGFGGTTVTADGSTSSTTVRYVFQVRMDRFPAGPVPKQLAFNDRVLSIEEEEFATFAAKAKAAAEWIGLKADLT